MAIAAHLLLHAFSELGYFTPRDRIYFPSACWACDFSIQQRVPEVVLCDWRLGHREATASAGLSSGMQPQHFEEAQVTETGHIHMFQSAAPLGSQLMAHFHCE